MSLNIRRDVSKGKLESKSILNHFFHTRKVHIQSNWFPCVNIPSEMKAISNVVKMIQSDSTRFGLNKRLTNSMFKRLHRWHIRVLNSQLDPQPWSIESSKCPIRDTNSSSPVKSLKSVLNDNQNTQVTKPLIPFLINKLNLLL